MKTNIKLLFATVLVTFLSACTDDIINKEPLDELSPETLFQTDGGFRSALDGVYGVMKQDFSVILMEFTVFRKPSAMMW